MPFFEGPIDTFGRYQPPPTFAPRMSLQEPPESAAARTYAPYGGHLAAGPGLFKPPNSHEDC